MSNVCPVCNGSRYVQSPMAEALKVALWAKKHGGAVSRALHDVANIELVAQLEDARNSCRRLQEELHDERERRARAEDGERRANVACRALRSRERAEPAVAPAPAPEPKPKPKPKPAPKPRHPRTIDPASIDEHEPGALYASARNDCEPIAPPPVSHVSSALAGEYSLPDWITELVDAMELQAEAMHA